MRRSLIQKTWRQSISATGLVVAFVLGAAVLAQPPDRAATDQASDAGAVEYLTRGPLHEAFAEPYEANPTASPLVTAEPPEPIEELPPEYRPEGDHVQWIPGYWAWDDERQDFVWVSGLWREVPPDQRWVPGYWVNTDSGYQWISGFWAGAELAEIEYLPAPPESIEAGPSAPAPAENHFYIPGHWVYQDSAYRWRPGFWSPIHENWVWVPAQYIWTPRGTLFREGYWDYDIAYRGVVFTPVYYRQPVYRSEQFVYRPRYAIDTGVNLLVHMFVRPNVRHYYFGDYYGPQYADAFEPWVVRYQQPTFYDPFYAQYRYRSIGQTANVLTWVTNQHQVFASSERIRPARTIAEQRQLIQTAADTDIDPTILRLAAVGESIENLVEEPDANFRFQPLNQDEVERIRESTRPLRELVQARRTVESEAVEPDTAALSGATADDAAADDASDEAGADPQQPRPSRNVGGPRGRLQLPEVAPSSTAALAEAGDAATEAGALAEETPERGRDASNDLPPGRQAMELTPEEQRDRRFNAGAAVPDITGTEAGSLGLGSAATAATGTAVQPGVTRSEATANAVDDALGTPESLDRAGRTSDAVGRRTADAGASAAGDAAMRRGDAAVSAADSVVTPGDTAVAPGGTAVTSGNAALAPVSSEAPAADAATRGDSERRSEAADQSPGAQGRPSGNAAQGPVNTGVGPGNSSQGRRSASENPANTAQGGRDAAQGAANAGQGRGEAGQARGNAAQGAVNTGVGPGNSSQGSGSPSQNPANTAQGSQNAAAGAANAGQTGGNAAQGAVNTGLGPGNSSQGRSNASQNPANTAQGAGNAAQGGGNAGQAPVNTGVGPGNSTQGSGNAGQAAGAAQRQPGQANVTQDPSAGQSGAGQSGAGQSGAGQSGAGQSAGAGRRTGVAGQQPAVIGQQPAFIGQQPGVITQQPGIISQQPGVIGQQPAVVGQQPGAAAQRGSAAAGAAATPGAAPTLQPTLPGTDTRDPNAGQEMRGDVRLIPDDRAGSSGRSRVGNAQDREQRMRPARPEGWPPRGERTRTLPARPGSDLGLERGALVPGGPPAIGGAAPGLNEAAVPRAGNLRPGGAPGVGRGAPNQTGTTRSREAQPHTLPDLTEEQGRQQRR